MYEVVRFPYPRGLIRQGETIVGSVQIPHAGERFAEEFNRHYARLDLRIRLPLSEGGATGQRQEKADRQKDG